MRAASFFQSHMAHFVWRVFADFADPIDLSPLRPHSVSIDHVRPIEMIVLAVSRPERAASAEVPAIPLVGLASRVL